MRPSLARAALAVVLGAPLGGCATYLYTSEGVARDASGKERQVVLFWTTTERKLWYDSTSGPVTLLTECGADAIQFDERPEGMVFRRRPNDVPAVPGAPAGGDVCGRILGASRLRDLDAGELKLAIYCRREADEFTVAGTDAYPAASTAPYVFRVAKRRIKDLAAEAPARPSCRP